MTAYGATPSGFVRPTQSELESEIDNILRQEENFGPDADTSPHSPLGIIKALRVDQEMRLWDAEEARYHAAYLDTADGVELDRLVNILGVVRKPATPEKVDLVFYGEEGTTVPADYAIKTKSGIEYWTTASGQITSSGSVTIASASVKTGSAYRVTAGSLTQIVQPLAGIQSVTNPEESTGGNSRETDVELRARAQETASVSAQDVGSLQEFKVLLEADADVRSVYIRENNRSTPDPVNGMPPNSLQFFVEGGTPSHVASLIFKYATGGITLHAVDDPTDPDRLVIQEVLDQNNDLHIIQFNRPKKIYIYVNLRLTRGEGWDDSQIDSIKGDIVKVIGGVHSTVDSQGNPVDIEYTGLGSGLDIQSLKILQEIAKYSGIANASMEFSTDQATYTMSIDIAPDEIAYTITDYVTVEVI